MAITRSDVEALSSTGWTQLSDSKEDELLDIARKLADDVYGGRVATLGEIEGNKDDFTKFLAAHMFELAEGGESQSESAGGGSVNYNTVTGEWAESLSETRYGRMALSYTRNRGAIGMVRTR